MCPPPLPSDVFNAGHWQWLGIVLACASGSTRQGCELPPARRRRACRKSTARLALTGRRARDIHLQTAPSSEAFACPPPAPVPGRGTQAPPCHCLLRSQRRCPPLLAQQAPAAAPPRGAALHAASVRPRPARRRGDRQPAPSKSSHKSVLYFIYYVKSLH